MNKIQKFLKESNAIEREYSILALQDSTDAWKYMYKECITENKDFTVTRILEAHKILTRNLLDKQHAGKFRTCKVYIGGRECSDDNLKLKLKDLCKEMNWYKKENIKNETQRNTIEKICTQFHIDFEHLHPFIDGNGRIGRIIWNIQRLKLGFDLHIIHEGKEQFEYYKIF